MPLLTIFLRLFYFACDSTYVSSVGTICMLCMQPSKKLRAYDSALRSVSWHRDHSRYWVWCLSCDVPIKTLDLLTVSLRVPKKCIESFVSDQHDQHDSIETPFYHQPAHNCALQGFDRFVLFCVTIRIGIVIWQVTLSWSSLHWYNTLTILTDHSRWTAILHEFVLLELLSHSRNFHRLVSQRYCSKHLALHDKLIELVLLGCPFYFVPLSGLSTFEIYHQFRKMSSSYFVCRRHRAEGREKSAVPKWPLR